MTRRARSQTSKASNKKTPEEATPWETMRSKMVPRVEPESAESDEGRNDSGTLSEESSSEAPKLANSPFVRRERQRPKKQKKSEDEEREKFFFEGSWVSAKTKTTLERLRQQINATDDTAARQKLEATIRQVRRNEEKRNKRLKRKQCFRCRSTDHQLADCPKAEMPSASESSLPFVRGNTSLVCFRCGESDHAARNCRAKVATKSKYPFANCFVCGQTGHISSECDQNERGIYPRGGCCRLCGSVKHLRKDCPGLRRTNWEDVRADAPGSKTAKIAPKPKKIIKF